MRIRSLIPIFSVAAFTLATSLHAQQEGPSNLRVIVRAETKGDAMPRLQPADIRLEFDGHATPVTRVRPLIAPDVQPVEVALLIDDGLRGNFGNQLQEIDKFVDETASPQVAVGIGYMRNGAVDFPAGFSTSAEVEKKAVRLPIAVGGISGSPYFCVQDLVKHWPTNTGSPRVILMLSNGIDYYNGSVSPLNQDSPYVDQTITDAQRAGVPVYSIYYGNRAVNSTLGSFSGQSYLSEVADGTGGKTFNQGTINPPSILPYFRQFDDALRESFLVSFQTGSRKQERLKVSSTVDGVKLHAQKAVGAGK